MAERNAILYQTIDKKLQQKIMAEDLSYTSTVKYGLSLEQGKRKVNEINTDRVKRKTDRMSQLEEQVRRLTNKASCTTFTRPTHAAGECPGRKVECYDCGTKGHFKNWTACRKKKVQNKGREGKDAKKNKNLAKHGDRAHKIQESETENEATSDTDSIGRVKEIVRATGSGIQSRQA